MNEIKELSDFKEFLRKTDAGVNYSSLWSSYRKDFTTQASLYSEANQRGYAINKEYKVKAKIFIWLHTEIIQKNLQRTGHIAKLLSDLLSFVLFGNTACKGKYGFDYSIDVQKKVETRYPNFVEDYKKMNADMGWEYSHNSYRSYFYYKNLIINCPSLIQEIVNTNCIEVGSGLCNFAMILTRKLSRYSYVCVDIPEMIPDGYMSFRANHPDDSIELYLPHQINEFLSSKASKKVIFILPSQLNSYDHKIQLDQAARH